jgi:hypothetical protein
MVKEKTKLKMKIANLAYSLFLICFIEISAGMDVTELKNFLRII